MPAQAPLELTAIAQLPAPATSTTTPAVGVSRRHWLWSAASLPLVGGIHALTLSRPSWAQSEPAQPTAAQLGTWRVVSRVGYGPTPDLLAEVQQASSPRAWALQQIELAHSASQKPPLIAPDLADFNAPLPDIFAADKRERELRKQIKADATQTAGGPGRSPNPNAVPERRMDFSEALAPEFYTRRLTLQTAAWRLTSCSQPELEPPLLARMTEFWFNHFNVFIGKGAVRPFVGHYLVNAIRAHAMGKFEDLLLASARHPAMLLYLDQAQSVATGSPGAQGRTRGLNENYARELMELHTLGVHGGYSQTDVRELARVLTGWTIGPNQLDGFRFAPRLHDSASKRVLWQAFPGADSTAGEQEGVDAIRLLARQPATAQRISLRLAQFFVADQPAPALVKRLSQSFLRSQGDIRVVLRVLFSDDEFWAAENRLFKTPMDFACSALVATQAASGADRRGLVLAADYLNNAGQPLHGWQTPDGYAFDAATWLAPEALTRRSDFAFALTRQQSPAEFLSAFLSPATRSSIAHEAPALQAGLMLSSPEFMYK